MQVAIRLKPTSPTGLCSCSYRIQVAKTVHVHEPRVRVRAALPQHHLGTSNKCIFAMQVA